MTQVTIDGTNLILRESASAWPYEIPLADLHTVAGLAQWSEHLREKAWITEAALREVAAKVAESKLGSPKR